MAMMIKIISYHHRYQIDFIGLILVIHRKHQMCLRLCVHIYRAYVYTRVRLSPLYLNGTIETIGYYNIIVCALLALVMIHFEVNWILEVPIS